MNRRSWDASRTLTQLAQRYAFQREDVLDPDLPIVDAHHHLWDRPGARYLIDEFLDDLRSGHNVTATIYVEGATMWRTDGPDHFRPVGESEFASGLAQRVAKGPLGEVEINAAVVAYANLRLGDELEPVIEAHAEAAQGRLKGIRNRAQYDDSIGDLGSIVPPPRLMQDPRFRKGLKRLADAGLVYDSWQFHPQIPELTDLARSVPSATIVLDHMGGLLGVEAYAGRRSEVFSSWRSSLRELARCPNVSVKLGGLGMPMSGFGFNGDVPPPDSETLATVWGPYIECCIELFGVERCMFQSNFPADKQSSSYAVLWNAFKRITQRYTLDERSALFSRTAKRVYALSES